MQDREEALKDDFQYDGGTYGYDESDDEWDDEEANWNGGEEEEPAAETKDESTAYLDFLNEEVSIAWPWTDISFFPVSPSNLNTYGCFSFRSLLTRTVFRPKSSRQQRLKIQTTSLARIACCWSRLSIGLILTLPSGMLSRVSGSFDKNEMNNKAVGTCYADTFNRTAGGAASVLC